MKNRLILKDMRRNKAVALMLLVFVGIAAMLLSLTSVLSVNLFNSIDTLMEEAKTPHFMQMHSGALDKNKLEEFAETTKGVDAF